MFQYIKNSFIENISSIRNIFLLAFILYYVYFCFNSSINNSNVIKYSIDLIINFFIINIIRIFLIFFIFLTAFFNRLIYQFPWQLLFSYFIIIELHNYIAFYNPNNIINNILFLFAILFIRVVLFFIRIIFLTLQNKYEHNEKYFNKNIIIEKLVSLYQVGTINKYIIILIKIILFVWLIIVLFIWLIMFIVIFFSYINQFNFILNWLIISFFFKLFILNFLLLKKLEQIAQNKIAIFETSEYQGFIKTNKLLINENFIFSIAFVYIIAFIYHYSLVYEYLYCILIATITVLTVNILKKNLNRM